MSSYSYAANNPLYYTDPDGRDLSPILPLPPIPVWFPSQLPSPGVVLDAVVVTATRIVNAVTTVARGVAGTAVMTAALVLTPANIGAKPYEELVPGQGEWKPALPPPYIPHNTDTKDKDDYKKPSVVQSNQKREEEKAELQRQRQEDVKHQTSNSKNSNDKHTARRPGGQTGRSRNNSRGDKNKKYTNKVNPNKYGN